LHALDRTNTDIGTVDDFNQYFGQIATDASYDPQQIQNSLHPDLDIDVDQLNFFEPFMMERLLATIKSKSSGPCSLPCWVLKQCSVELAEPVCHIINISLSSGKVPAQWLASLVTPIPKVPQPKTLNDFRPISVTPILCRLTEKLIVNRWLRPALKPIDICDQFAFRPTGSTTIALTFCFHHVTRLLETNKFVRCFLIDFKKAFDTVKHSILISKLKRLKLPHCILNWIINFLSNRSQQVTFGGTTSSSFSITRSIIQGSGLGPTLYIVMESDLHPMSNWINLLFKYADDTNLLVPEITDISARAEIQNIRSWAFENDMEINWDKTKELVFRRPNIGHCLLPDPILNIEQVIEARLLGVEISAKFNFVSHVNNLLAICSQRLFLLKLLRQQGMPQHEINIVYCAIIVSRITYALPAWSGFLTADLRHRIDLMLKKCFKFGYSQQCDNISKLCEHADSKLFNLLQKPESCAHYLLPPSKPTTRSLRPRGHNYQLPRCHYTLYKNSFICRTLYRKCETSSA